MNELNKRIENAKQSQNEYKDNIDIKNVLIRVESNQQRISVDAKLRKAMQRKLCRRKELRTSLEKNNILLQSENKTLRRSFAKTEKVGLGALAGNSTLSQQLGSYDELQDEQILLKEHNLKLNEQLALYQSKYLSVAKERRKLQKSLKAIFEFTNKYLTEVKDRSLSSGSLDEVERYIYIQNETERLHLSCYDKGKAVLDEIEIKFGPADREKEKRTKPPPKIDINHDDIPSSKTKNFLYSIIHLLP